MVKKKVKKTENNEVSELKAQLTRALADYDNLQKRVERESIEMYSRVKTQFVLSILPAIEMLYNVQKHLNDPGLALSISQFEQVLSEEGIEKIEPKVEDQFDENFHEAIDAIEDSEKAGKIAEVLSFGWKFTDGTVISHAKVRVFK